MRSEIAPLLPATATRIVDIGCGVGATAAWLKTRYPAAHTIGLEGQGDLIDQLKRNVDEAHIVDLNDQLPDVGQPDLVLFLDVLEHLVQPEKLLKALVERLAPGGVIIVSLPNVAHYSVAVPLLLNRRFEYADAGILDRTHLRFFVKESAVALMNSAGLEVSAGVVAGAAGPRASVIDAVTAGLLRDRLTKQYIMCGRLMTSGGQGRIDWRKAPLHARALSA